MKFQGERHFSIVHYMHAATRLHYLGATFASNSEGKLSGLVAHVRSGRQATLGEPKHKILVLLCLAPAVDPWIFLRIVRNMDREAERSSRVRYNNRESFFFFFGKKKWLKYFRGHLLFSLLYPVQHKRTLVRVTYFLIAKAEGIDSSAAAW